MRANPSAGKIIAGCIALLLSMAPCLPFSGEAASDPTLISDSEGIATVSWNFADAEDYYITNVSLEPGFANLSFYETEWMKQTQQQLDNGTLSNLDISPSGRIALAMTDTVQLLGNGNFTSPDDLGEWDYNMVDNWTSTYQGDFWDNRERRIPTGGHSDNKYCWWNYVGEWDAFSGYNAIVWLNQSFVMPSVPLSVNISAFHNFQNNSYAAEPGSAVKIKISQLAPPFQNITVYDSGLLTESYTAYKPIWWGDAGIFTEPGEYNITLLTYTDTRGNASNVFVPGTGIDNFWDNASVTFRAYRPNGTYVSEVFDAGSYATWKNISWDETLPPGADVSLFVRTGNTNVSTDSIWSGWSSPLSDPSGSAIDRPLSRYLQYRVEFTTSTTNVTPVLSNFSVSYDRLHLGGIVETHDFLPSNIVRWGFFSHEEETRGQSVRYRYSTDSGITWKDVPLNGDLRAIQMNAGGGNGIRFRAVLNTTDTAVTPSIMKMGLTYVSSVPNLVLEPIWNRSGAMPGDLIRLRVFFNNTAQSISSTIWLNIYLDERLEYVSNNSQTLSIFDTYIPDSNTGIQKYIFKDVPLGQNCLWIDARVRTGVIDGETLQTTVTLDYLDPLENRVESMLRTVPMQVFGPRIALELFIQDGTADVGDTLNCTLFLNNTGSGIASIAWINGTRDERLETGNISWVLFNITGNSSRTIIFAAALKENVAQGSTIITSFTAEYSDSSGHMLRAETNPVGIRAELSSNLDLVVVTQSTTVNSSEMLVITVHYNNTGFGQADSVKFNFTVPHGLEYVSSSEECIHIAGMCRWEIFNVGPGPHSFTFMLRALKLGENSVVRPIVLYMQVADPVNGIMPAETSVPVAVAINRVYTFQEKIYWPWSGLAIFIGSVAAVLGLWYVFKPEPPSITDAFVIYRDGRLISHKKSKSGQKSELDGDLVGAMLTAVQEFVSDSLSNDKSDKVKKLEFGDKELFLERGKYTNLVIIYSGSLSRKLESNIKEIIDRIESEHGFLNAWDGRMTQLSDIDAQLDTLIQNWQNV
jgi:hypothetical protein